MPPVTGLGAHEVSERSAVEKAASPARATGPIEVNVPATYRTVRSGDIAIAVTAPPRAFGFHPPTVSFAVVAASPPRAFPPIWVNDPPRNQPPPGLGATARTTPEATGKVGSGAAVAASSASALPVGGESSVKSPPMYVTGPAGCTAQTVPFATHATDGEGAGEASAPSAGTTSSVARSATERAADRIGWRRIGGVAFDGIGGPR